MFNIIPWLVTLLIITLPIVSLLHKKRTAVIVIAIELVLILAHILSVYFIGLNYYIQSRNGNHESLYEYARWIENHDEQIGSLILWPIVSDPISGFRRLEQAANQSYPPAIYALGIRLKYGQHVPRPDDWNGADGNFFPQPVLGQELIDKAIRLGYHPQIPEADFYWKEYRKRYDP